MRDSVPIRKLPSGRADGIESGTSWHLWDTLDYGDTLTRIARLVVRNLVAFCILDLVDGDGKLRRMKVLHRDQGKP